MIDQLMAEGNRSVLVFQNGAQSWDLSGMQVAFLLGQLQEFIPQLEQLPFEERARQQIRLAIGSEEISIQAGSIPIYLEMIRRNLGGLLEAPAQNLLMPPAQPMRLIEADEAILINHADLEEFSSFEKTQMESIFGHLKACFLDPGNSEKSKKYTYSLYKTKESLDGAFPGWKRLLPPLAEFAQSSRFAKHAYCLLNALKTSSETNEDSRVQYAYILGHLREALTQPHNNTRELQQIHQILLYLCHFKFTRVQPYPFFEDFISKALRAAQSPGDGYELPKFTLRTLAHSISHANHRLASVPPEYRQRASAKEYKKLQGTLGFDFDPTASSNTPWIHSIQTILTPRGEKNITVLRHGTPTQDPTILGAALRELQNGARQLPFVGNFIPAPQCAIVIPEYKAHLQAEPTKISLYVNHQEHGEDENHTVHGEADRSRAIQQLENDHPNFHFLALPLDGPLWKKTYLDTVSITQLKEALFNSLSRQENGFGLPRAFNHLAEPHAQGIEELLGRVHSLYFNNADLNSSAQKKTFMMLFYSELKDYTKKFLDIDFLVSACKDNKDRGNASTTVDMMKNLVKLGKENDPEALRELFFSVLAPFIIKNEEIIHERLELALHVIEHFSLMSEAQKQSIRGDSFYTIKDQIVPKEGRGWAQMVGADQFITHIDGMKERKEKRVVHDPRIDQTLSSSFLHANVWHLNDLEKQIRRDLPCLDIQLNGVRITEFKTLCKQLGLAPDFFQTNRTIESLDDHEKNIISFMTLLQQGIAAEGMRDLALYLNGNAAELVVSQRVIQGGYPTTIHADFDPKQNIQTVRVTQKMALRHPEGGQVRPILVKLFVDRHFAAKISWQFI